MTPQSLKSLGNRLVRILEDLLEPMAGAAAPLGAGLCGGPVGGRGTQVD